ncbi:hypothetical protein AR158_c136L [Paramecium bursaria Chlorella virus AR158]|uniref:hypothetical protein n=1 Tax=Paramecium bursaria Chlorella virus AR158 TaxID=380598 RepID=UPI00015AA7E7|nr:hypothetical protein AR158_c136L [Paramecium bursaria Chlorella virus AR158]ABU43682.1 hypothetical protein AR158_c136L [Paramecium bursaria Chlorella virus AR158]
MQSHRLIIQSHSSRFRRDTHFVWFVHRVFKFIMIYSSLKLGSNDTHHIDKLSINIKSSLHYQRCEVSYCCVSSHSASPDRYRRLKILSISRSHLLSSQILKNVSVFPI